MSERNEFEEMPSTLVDEFFFAPNHPVTTHEEWLLRMYAQLMHREAHVVSMLEKAEEERRHGASRRCRTRGGQSTKK